MAEVTFADPQSVSTILAMAMVKMEMWQRLGNRRGEAVMGGEPTLLDFAGEAAAELAELHRAAAGPGRKVGFHSSDPAVGERTVHVSLRAGKLVFRVR